MESFGEMDCSHREWPEIEDDPDLQTWVGTPAGSKKRNVHGLCLRSFEKSRKSLLWTSPEKGRI